MLLTSNNCQLIQVRRHADRGPFNSRPDQMGCGSIVCLVGYIKRLPRLCLGIRRSRVHSFPSTVFSGPGWSYSPLVLFSFVTNGVSDVSRLTCCNHVCFGYRRVAPCRCPFFRKCRYTGFCRGRPNSLGVLCYSRGCASVSRIPHLRSWFSAITEVVGVACFLTFRSRADALCAAELRRWASKEDSDGR